MASDIALFGAANGQTGQLLLPRQARRQVREAGGDFNDWDLTSLPMQRQPDGCWFVQVPLTHGHHQYVFLVDGEPELDPVAAGIVRVDAFGKASVVAVS